MGGFGSKAVNTSLKDCTIWKSDRSPACRAVMMALDALNLSITEVDVNIDKAEHRSQDITKLNPLQTLPIFKDRELVLYDSHVINPYLAARYCNFGQLLPLDPGNRAKTEQLLHYDSGTLYPRFLAASNPILYENCTIVMPQQVCEIESAYSDLERLLIASGKQHFGGSWVTLADISLAATVSTLDVLVPVDKDRYPCLSIWMFNMSEESFFTTANRKGLGEFSRRIDCGSRVEEVEFKCPRSSLRRRAIAGLAVSSSDTEMSKQ